jgi:hypothetical protein
MIVRCLAAVASLAAAAVLRFALYRSVRSTPQSATRTGIFAAITDGAIDVVKAAAGLFGLGNLRRKRLAV